MRIAASTMDGVLVVSLGESEIVASNAETLKAELSGHVGEAAQEVVLDLSPVAFIDSSGAGLLIYLMKAIQRAGGTLRVSGLGAQPMALIRTVNLDRVIPISRDVSEALASMKHAGSRTGGAAGRSGAREAASDGGQLDQLLAHIRLSYEALFGAMPESLTADLRRALQAHRTGEEGGAAGRGSPLQDRLALEKRQILGELAEGMAVRFRNVLSLVVGRINFLRMVTTDEKICSSLDVMEKAALEGMAAVRRVEELTDGSAKRRHERISVRELLDDALEMVRMKWEDRFTRAGKSLRVIREFMGNPQVTGAPAELKHAFMDVLLNAMEAMPDGGVLNVSVNQSAGRMTVSIADTGRGMTPETISRAFEPLFSTKGLPGAGLGLPIARAVIESHGGTIVLESQPGRGTTALIHLPAAAEEDLSPEQARPSAAPASTPARVLVVDDEVMVCDLLQDILGAMGCEVVTVTSGREGVDLCRSGRFDLVMTDLAMPGMNGWEVAREVKLADPAVPVALFSAWGSQLDAESMRDRGVDFLFPKPFEISMIRNVISAAVDLLRIRRDAPATAASPAEERQAAG